MNIEIANRLVQLRKQHGYSQEELAAKLGLSRQAVSKWERAEASPDTDNLIMLSRVYSVSLDELLKTDEPIPEPEPDKGVKVTEGTIQAQLDSDPELVELKAAVVRANADYITLDSMLKALDHKKSMIEIVSRLTLSEKYAAAKANDPTLQGGAYGDASADAVRDYLNQ